MNLALLLLQIAIILASCRFLHSIIRRFGQPPVMGEIIAGLLLGPSLLGWAAPVWYSHLFPPDSLPALNAMSQIGLVLFMFLVGMRVDLSEVRAFRRVAGLSGLLSIAVPFLGGLALARPLHSLAPTSPLFPFSFFIAVSMSITAFPVLARILADQRLTATRLGHVAVACAAFNDLAAWTFLAWITAVTRASDGHAPLLVPIAKVVLYMVVMVVAVRPLLRLLTDRFAVTREFAVLLIFAFLSGCVTEWIGIHALFGAFFAGVILPRNGTILSDAANRIEPVAMAVLIPLFFSYTGIRTNLGLVGGGLWMYEAAIIAIAVAGKMGGAFLGATIMKFGLRDSLALGTLLNTRGLVELVVLNVGLDLKILSPTLFSMLVLMALATTLMTVPLLHYVLPVRRRVYDVRDPARQPRAHGRTG